VVVIFSWHKPNYPEKAIDLDFFSKSLSNFITKKECAEFSKGEKWFDKLFNVKYLPLFHHFKAIYQFAKHIIFLVKIVVETMFLKLGKDIHY
jgi:hypothetical protein